MRRINESIEAAADRPQRRSDTEEMPGIQSDEIAEANDSEDDDEEFDDIDEDDDAEDDGEAEPA